MNNLMLSVIAMWGLAVTLGVAYCVSIAREITYVTLPDGRRAERKIPLLYRVLLPFAGNVRGLVRSRRLDAARDAAARGIRAAGLDGLLSADEFLSLRFLVPIFCGVAWSLTVSACAAGMPDSIVSENALILSLAGIALFAVEPALWLKGTIRRRHDAIFRALPFVLDLLTLSVEAGMDFMSALQRNCRQRKLDALNEELIRMTHEIQVGTPRKAALKAMAERVGQTDLRSVAFSLVQADELGVPIGSILRIQSEQLRARRFERAEKLAMEAPVKMLGPLMLCIFPSVFLILLAPMFMQATKSFF